MRFDVLITGSYSSSADPNFDMLAALQSHLHQGISAVDVKAIALYQDGADLNNSNVRCTAPNSDGALSGTGNKVYTFEIWTGGTAANGSEGSGAEVSNAVVVDITLSFLAVLSMTGPIV
jgi:hypothetical protein